MLSEQNLALICPIMRAFDSGLGHLKSVVASLKERVLEDHMFQRSKWRGFTMHLSGAHMSLHVNQVSSLRFLEPLSGIC